MILLRLRIVVSLLVCLASVRAEGERSLLDFLNLGRSDQEEANQKQLLEILAAFEPVVASAGKSTVWVLEGDQKLALGTIIRSDGVVLTKASEVEGRPLRCQFADGSHSSARIERLFPKYDVAWLRVKREGLPVARFNKEEPILGSLIATPGPGRAVSGVGVVSVGIRDLSGAGQGYLGIVIGETEGVLQLQRVSPNSAAEKAGLEKGDKLLSIDGMAFKDVQAFVDQVSLLEPGTQVEIVYERRGQERQASVTLGSREEAVDLFDSANPMDLLGGATSVHRTGYPQAWQHDIGLVPFRMGGPVVDLDGRILGINIARSGRVKTYVIPSRVVLGWLAEEPSEPEIEDGGDLDQLLRDLEEAEKSLKEATRALDALPKP